MVDLRFASSLQIMLALGYRASEETLLNSNDLADSLGTNPALVRKLMIPLAQKGLIETFKGKTGGAKIGKAPKSITLREIYEAAVTDKDIVCSRETSSHKCPIGSCMEKVFDSVSDGMENAMLKYLDGTTLQQLLNQLHSSSKK